MLRADEFLTAPAPELLTRCLREVLDLGNGTATTGLLAPTEALCAEVAARLAEPEGVAVWAAPDTGEVTLLRVVWASDYQGRRQLRLQTLRRWSSGPASNPATLFPHATRSPAELVYERHAYRFQRPGGETFLVLGCACGAIGTLAEIAWMGDRCGPCHDRTEAEVARPEGMLRHERAARAEGKLVGRPMACLPDGERQLVLRDRREAGTVTHELVLWHLGRQEEVQRWPLTSGNLGVNFNVDSDRLGLLTPRSGGVQLRILAWPEGDEVASVEIPGTPRCFTLAPGAGAAYVGNLGQLISVDLTRPDASFARFPLPAEASKWDPLDLACSPDGRWLAVVWKHGELVLYDRLTHRAAATFALPNSARRAVLVFPPEGEVLLVCDEQGGVWFFEVPGLRPLGRFHADALTINGLDVCGPWLMLLPLEDAPVRAVPWEVLRDYARRA